MQELSARRPRHVEPRAGRALSPSTSCSTPASSMTRFFDVEVVVSAKSSATDLLMEILTAPTAGPTTPSFHFLLTLWFCNTRSGTAAAPETTWGPRPARRDAPRAGRTACGARDRRRRCSPRTRLRKLFGTPTGDKLHTKDAFYWLRGRRAAWTSTPSAAHLAAAYRRLRTCWRAARQPRPDRWHRRRRSARP